MRDIAARTNIGGAVHENRQRFNINGNSKARIDALPRNGWTERSLMSQFCKK